MFAALTTIGVSAVEFNTSYYSYDINHNGEISEDEQGVTITGFYGLNGGETVVIPATIEGKKVLAIGLEGATTAMNIPGAEKIGALDLTQATNLKIILPHAFYDCKNIKGVMQYNVVGELTPMIRSDTVEVVGDCAFYGCTALKELYFSKCQTIGDYAFGACTGITYFIALNCIEIGDYAFSSCTALKELYLMNCQTIGSYAFICCTALEYIDVSSACKPSYTAFLEVPDTCYVNTDFLQTYLKMYGVN